jgi:hypothetical protein
MNFADIPVFGDTSYRGPCPQEYVEQASIINRIRQRYPDTWGRLVLHPRNEGLKEAGQFSTVQKHKAEGMAVGAADIVIPAAPSFVCEVKRQDHSKSKWQPGQQEYLAAAIEAGAFACVALGAVGAWEAFEAWLQHYHS